MQDQTQDKKVRFGILSTAEIAPKVLYAINDSKNAVAVAVASRSLEKAQKWGEKYGVKTQFGSYQELVDCKEIDAVYIPLPTAFKKEWAIKCANAGKAILLEKPLPGVLNTNDLQEIVDACKANNVQFLDGTMWPHSIRSQQIRKELEQKSIGNIRRVIASFTFHGPNEEWIQGGNGRTDKTREPMGVFGDMGWYPIGAIMFSYNYELPVKVQMNFVELNKVDTIIACSGTLWFKDNRMAHFDCDAKSYHRSQYEIVGEDGSIRVEDLTGGFGRTGNFSAYFENFYGSDQYKKDDQSGKESIVQVKKSNHTAKMVESISENVLNGKPDESWPQQSLACQRVMVALFKSANNNNEIINLE